jgi:hypothetical protein
VKKKGEEDMEGRGGVFSGSGGIFSGSSNNSGGGGICGGGDIINNGNVYVNNGSGSSRNGISHGVLDISSPRYLMMLKQQEQWNKGVVIGERGRGRSMGTVIGGRGGREMLVGVERSGRLGDGGCGDGDDDCIFVSSGRETNQLQHEAYVINNNNNNNNNNSNDNAMNDINNNNNSVNTRTNQG